MRLSNDLDVVDQAANFRIAMTINANPQNSAPSAPTSGSVLAVFGNFWVLVRPGFFDGWRWCWRRHNDQDRHILLGAGGDTARDLQGA